MECGVFVVQNIDIFSQEASVSARSFKYSFILEEAYIL